MPYRTPRWLSQYCKQVLPPMFGNADGRRILELVKAIVETDRWTSFDRYHDTTRTLVREYERAGAATDVYGVRTGGQLGTGRWIVQEAADVTAVTVDVVKPKRQRIVDYKHNPWHAVRWCTSTPAEGMTNELVVIDTEEKLKQLPRNGLAGKMVLTPLSAWRQFADKGAAGLLIETPIKGHPDATRWASFGWGGPQIEDAAARLIGISVSEQLGKQLRQLVAKHGSVRLKTCVDVRRYVGSHDLVSGLVWGADDPQDEVWALAHSLEPGAADNASGVAVCVEIARIIESLIAEGKLPRPKRTIRLLNGYECYSFFNYLENVKRFQTPLAGVCIDCVGIRPELCDRRLEWHGTIPMSAGFVDGLGEGIVRAALRTPAHTYRCVPMPFVSTADTLIGDPKYGFPCPWIATYRGHKKPGYDAYHSSADTSDILSPDGLATVATAMAAYLYFLADADSENVTRLATWETDRAVAPLLESRKRLSPADAEFVRTRHQVSMERLQRWMWGGDRSAILSHLAECERQVREAVEKRTTRGRRRVVPQTARRVPRRKVALSPTLENTPSAIGKRIRESGLPSWTLFWADGHRALSDIAVMTSCELQKEITIDQITGFFDAHADLGYVDFVEPKDTLSKAQLVRDLKALGLERGMDVMVHSSLSSIGHVLGGADGVIDALLSVIGRKGTLVMPSFNHSNAEVFNPLTTPSTNGAIPDALWRRPEAARSVHTSHALAAIGTNAEELTRDHLEIGVWEQDSPIGRLIHRGGYILSIGPIGESRTAYHVAENSRPCGCIDPFGSDCKLVAPDGTVRSVHGLAWRSEVCPVSPQKMTPTLDRRKLQSHGKVGHADATLVKAKDLWDVRRQQLKRACPVCKIKPRPYTWPRRKT